MNNIFEPTVSNGILDRINKLTPETQALWGKMNVAQMLAHCNVTYEMVYSDKHPKPGAIKGFLLKMMIKGVVTSDKPYSKNGRTAPQFIIADKREFEAEKKRLTDHITKTHELGKSHFNGKESHSFGPLSTQEWSNMFYKHLNHHLEQFGV